MSVTVIIDSREKSPWTLKNSVVSNFEVKKLDTGDYAIKGLEDVLCLERKKSVSEIALNMNEERFKRVLERMAEFEYKFLICEFSMQDIMDYPVGSNIPKSRWKKMRIKAPYIMRRISEMQTRYGIHVVLAGNAANAEHAATNIIKRVVEKYVS